METNSYKISRCQGYYCPTYRHIVCGQTEKVVMPRIPRQQPRLDFLNLYPAVVPSVIMFMMPLQQLDGLPCNVVKSHIVCYFRVRARKAHPTACVGY